MPSGFSIGNDSVTIEQSVRLLGIDLDNQLNFNLHIKKICKSDSNQLNALVKLKEFLRNDSDDNGYDSSFEELLESLEKSQ